MSQRNETAILISSLLIVVMLVGVGFWWLNQRFVIIPKGSVISNTPTTPSNADGVNNQITAQSNPGNTLINDDFAKVQGVPAGLFSYGGSTTWAPIRLLVDSAIQAARPEFKLRYVAPVGIPPGSGAGIKMLLDGQISFAQSSRPIKEKEFQQAQQRGFNLLQIPVAIDGVAIAVNPNLNIAGLTLSELKAIYTGKIDNWNQVGGPNIPITPYSRKIETGGTVDFFVEQILGGDTFGANVQFVATTTEGLQRVYKSQGGIYYASAPELVPQCSVKPVAIGRDDREFVPPYKPPFISPQQCPAQRNQLNVEAFQQGKYPITRYLFVIVKQNGQIEQLAGEAYANLLLTPTGQAMIEKAGFVRIR